MFTLETLCERDAAVTSAGISFKTSIMYRVSRAHECPAI